MTLSLPHEFESTGVVKLILRGVAGLLLAVVLPGILYSMLISGSKAAAAQLLLIGSLAALFGWVVAQNLRGSEGTITAQAIELRPARLLGMRLPGPEGRFPIDRFTAVRVERVFGPINTTQAPRWHERVSVMGSPGTPDVLIARTDSGAGVVLARELASALGLSYQEEHALR
jgi:hypothetical protein